MKKIVSLVVFLAVVSAVSGAVLAFVNGLTAPIIENMGMEKEKATLSIMYPDTEFKSIEFTDESGLVKGVYEAVGKGIAFKCEVIGYNSSNPISFMVGINDAGEIDSFVVVSQQETNGIGSRIAEEEFKNMLLGNTDGNIETLSGATVSSSAVKNGIKAVFDLYPSVKGGN